MDGHRKKKKELVIMLLLAAIKKRVILQQKSKNRDAEVAAIKKSFKKRNTIRFKEYCSAMIINPDLVLEHLSVSKEVLELLVQAVDSLRLHHNLKMTSHEQCILFLLFATGGSSFGYLSRGFGVSKATISSVISRVSKTINCSLSCIKLPESAVEWRHVEGTFLRRNMIPTLGCLDGKHIRIRAPPHSGSLFFNYKSFFSFVLMALVDGDGRFLWVDIEELVIMLLLAAIKKRVILQQKSKNRDAEVAAIKKSFKKRNTIRFKEYCSAMIINPDLVLEHLSVSKEVLELLVQAVDSLRLHHNLKMTSHEQCILFLLFATGGSSFGYLSRGFGVSKATISSVISRVSKTINCSLSCIKLPESAVEWRHVEGTFLRRNMIPTLGCLDGKHIRIRAPPHSGSLFFNYKSFFSFVLMALVDGDGRFLWVDIGSPGSSNDASIYNSSTLKTVLDDPSKLPKPTMWNLETVMPSFAVGDGIFPLGQSLMKPYGRRSLTPEEAVYNRKLSNARVRVEHAFGLLAKRFRLLDRSIECRYKLAVDIITALCHLHNKVIGVSDKISPRVATEIDVLPYKDAKEQREYLKNFLNS